LDLDGRKNLIEFETILNLFFIKNIVQSADRFRILEINFSFDI